MTSNDEIWAGEVVHLDEYNYTRPIAGKAIVTEVNMNEKTITMSMDTGEQQVSDAVDTGAEPSNEEVGKDPVEEAAERFTMLLPFVSKTANASVSKGSLVRVLHAFAEFPLGKGKPRLLNQNEQLLFNILQELQGYKSTILQDFMKKNLAAMQMEKMLDTNGGVETQEKEVNNV
jgi:hypothetical protein